MGLIDADVHECWACVHNNCGCDTWCEYGEAFELREDVKNAPTIKAVLVAHGEWIAQDEGLTKFMCSICKGENYGGHEKFCPNCGANMRKKV